SVLRQHLQSQSRILEKQSRLRPPKTPSNQVPDGYAYQTDSSVLRVLHQLTNSLPHTQSGYSMRSHSVLRALRKAGVEVEAVTRTGQPRVVGRFPGAGLHKVDGIDYRRILPARIPRRREPRYSLQANELAQHAREFHANLIHTTTPYDNALIAEAAAR